MSKVVNGLKRRQPGDGQRAVADGEIRAWRAAVATVDRIAGNMEQRWGVDRLQTLVPAELAAKFASAQEQLDIAIASGDIQTAAQKAAALGRGWMQLDKAAREAGHTPEDVGSVWFYDLDGDAYAVCLRNMECAAIAARYPDHRAVALEELLRLMRAAESGRWVSAIKDAFPGATLGEIGPKRVYGGVSANLDDDLPF